MRKIGCLCWKYNGLALCHHLHSSGISNLAPRISHNASLAAKSDRISSRNSSVEEGVVEETCCSANVWQNARSVEVARCMMGKFEVIRDGRA